MSRQPQAPSMRRHRSMKDLPAVLKDTQKESIEVFVNLLRVTCELESASASASLNSSVCEGGSSNADTPVCCEDSSRRILMQCAATTVEVTAAPETCSTSHSCTPVNSTSSTDESNPNTAPRCNSATNNKRPSSLGPLTQATVVSTAECKVVNTVISAPDPPILLSPCADLVAARASAQHDGSIQRGRSASSPKPVGATARIVRAELTGQPEALCCTTSQTLITSSSSSATAIRVDSIDTRVRSKRIAERLRMIGDDIDEKQIAQILQDLTSQISADPSPDPSQLVCTVQSLLSSFRVQSWSAVGSFFRVGLKLLQQLTVLLGGSKSHVSDVRWPIYINAIIQFLDEDVSPWISSQGGWEQLLIDPEQRLTSQISPPHPHTSTSPPHPHPSTSSPHPLRPHSSSPAINISSTSSLGSHRASLWSLSESGSLVDEFGNEETNGTPQRDLSYFQFTSDLEDSTRSSVSEMEAVVVSGTRNGGGGGGGGGGHFGGLSFTVETDDEIEDSVFGEEFPATYIPIRRQLRPYQNATTAGSSSPERQQLLCDSGIIVSSLENFSDVVFVSSSSHCQMTTVEPSVNNAIGPSHSTPVQRLHQQQSTPIRCQRHMRTAQLDPSPPDLSSRSEPVLMATASAATHQHDQFSQSYESASTCTVVTPPCHNQQQQQRSSQHATSSSSSSLAQVLASPFQSRRILQSFKQQSFRQQAVLNRENEVVPEGAEPSVGSFDRNRSYSLPMDQIRRRSHGTRGGGRGQTGAGGRGQRQEVDSRRMSAEDALMKFVYLSEKATQVYTVLSDYMQK